MNPLLGVFLAKFWILDPLYTALGTLMAWFYDVIPSFGGAIILLTLAVRLLTFPLTAKQARAQQELQRHQPEIKRLQAKYKGDKQKLNEEMMKFYKENHVNPFGGCLPLLVQFPVLIVLYRLILDLTHKPPKHIPTTSSMYGALRESGGKMVSWGMDLSQRASHVTGGKRVPFLILVVGVMATGYYQQRQLTSRLPKESNNSQMAVMGKIMPVFFGFISWSIPAGVVVYFFVSNIWQIGQQAVMFRNQPKPEPSAKDGPKKGAAGGPGKDRRSGKGLKGITSTPGARGTKGAKGGRNDKVSPAKGKAGAKDGTRRPKNAPPARTKGQANPGAKGAQGRGAKKPAPGRGPASGNGAKNQSGAKGAQPKKGRSSGAGGSGNGAGDRTGGSGAGPTVPAPTTGDGKKDDE
jgi:YidC/Oxa1 family membrane protein insertase